MEKNNNLCIICLESINNYSCKTSCGHIMCLDCLLSLMKMECPMCRKNLEKELSSKLKKIISKNRERYENKINYSNQVSNITSNEIFNEYDFPPLNQNNNQD